MSFVRSLGVFIISSLFTIFTFLAITSYTTGSLVQKDNIKDLVITEFSQEMINQQCEDLCGNFTEEQKPLCVDECLAQFSNVTEEYINEAIDEIYENKIFNMSLNEMILIISNTILFAFLAVISGVLLLFVPKNPLKVLGKDIVWISISLLISGFLLSFITLPDIPLAGSILDYLSQGLRQQIYFGIVFLIIGIVLLIANYYRKKRVDKKSKKKK